MPDDWIVAAAFNTMMDVFEKAGPMPGIRDPEGKTKEHMMWLVIAVMDKGVTGRKAHRWLSYAQGGFVLLDILTLEQAKQANYRASMEN